MLSKQSGYGGTIIGGILMIVLGAGLSTLLFGLSWVRGIETIVRVMLPFIVITLGVTAFGFLFPRREREITLVSAGIVGIIVSVLYGIFIHSYNIDKIYSSRAEIVDAATTDFQERAPWVVANNYASKYQGDDIGKGMNVKHVPVTGVDDSSRYSRLIVGRAMLGNAGYTSIREFDLPKIGPIPKSATESCEVPEIMGKRFESMVFPWRSLSNSLSWKNPFLHYSYDDGYGYCDNGEPVIVMPLYEYDGFWFVTESPAGAAVYTTKGLQVMSPEELVENNIQGPTFPQSLSETYMNSMKAMDGYGKWINGTSGYDLTTKDEDDSNSDNAESFSLVDESGSIQYVTPLTPRGGSESITATFVAPAQQKTENAVFRIETNHDLPATSSIETSIRSSNVKGDPNWGSRWADGTRMRVYEIVPNSNGYWVASIGLGQEVSYRAKISPDGNVEVQKLSNEDGDTDVFDNETVVVNTGKDFSEMTDDELIQIIKSAAEELENR